MLAQHAEDHRLQLELRQLERRRVRLPGAEGEQVLDELLQLDAVVAQDARHFLLLNVELPDGAVEQQLGAFANVGERRLELVRHVPQELVLLVGRFLEAMPQPFELSAQRFDVVRPADGDRPAEIAFAELADRPVDLPHRSPDEQQEQADEDQRARDQRRRQPRELLLRGARALLQRFEADLDRVAHADLNGARRVGQHAEARDDRRRRRSASAPTRNARWTSFEIDDKPHELIADGRVARQRAQRRDAALERGLVAVVERQRSPPTRRRSAAGSTGGRCAPCARASSRAAGSRASRWRCRRAPLRSRPRARRA